MIGLGSEPALTLSKGQVLDWNPNTIQKLGSKFFYSCKATGLKLFSVSAGRFLSLHLVVTITPQLSPLTCYFLFPQRIVVARTVEIDDITVARILEHWPRRGPCE